MSQQLTIFSIAVTITTKNILLNDLNTADRTLLNLSDLFVVNAILYGGPQFDESQNAFILNLRIKYILISKRFSGRLF